MNSDLYILPLFRRGGQDYSYLPGLHVAKAPRRAARGRGDDRLLIHVAFRGSFTPDREQTQKLLADMAQGYYHAAGSVTSGIREQAERLNLFLLQRNQEDANAEQSLALMNMLAMREDRVTIAQCGPVHAFLLGRDDIRHFYDPKTSGRGLGLSRTTDIRFFQTELPPDSLLLTLTALPSGWDEKTLQGVQGQKLAVLRRRFLGQAGSELDATLLTARPGKGQVRMLTSSGDLDALAEQEERAPEPKPASPPVKAAPDSGRAWEAVDAPDEEEVNLEDTGPVVVREVNRDEARTNSGAPSATPPQTPEWLNVLSERLQSLAGRLLPPLRSFLLRLLPEDSSLDLPSSTMAIIAGIVPIVVVVLVSIIYLQFGRGQLYANYLAQAESAAAAAVAREDPAEVRQAWETALDFASRAVAYDETDAAADLLSEVQAALDDIDAIERLDFQPALFDTLSSQVSIQRMGASSTDLYMLDAASGSVLRAFLSAGGYQYDENFQCGPGPYGGTIVGALVDMALLPRDNPQEAVLVAMDGNGNLIYCILDERPLGVTLETPDSNWGDPRSITVEDGDLYVLDPLTNAVWIYFGEDYSFVEEPRFFFGAEVPGIQDAIDISVKEGELFLLDVSGEMARCTFSPNLEEATTCEDPAEYTDSRPGREDGPTVEGALFLALQTTDPPEPSVYMVDPIARAVYQFSLRLSLIRQYRSIEDLPDDVVTAFAVSPNRALFLAFENQVYIGFLP